MNDITSILLWWGALLGIGLIFFPITARFFEQFLDYGYIFSKILGIAVVSFIVFLFGLTHIIPFTSISIWIALALSVIGSFYWGKKKLIGVLKQKYKILLTEEILFLLTFAFWAYIRGHQPDIHGLEKFMDYGFTNSILRSQYFPPKDMWFPPYSINYYYFGHLVTAVLIRLTQIPSQIGFNLMVATIFGMAFVGSFSIGINLTTKLRIRYDSIVRGVLAACLLTLAGNLHTIYALFTAYKTDNPVPPWQLLWSPGTYPNSYWYANATRFIPYTIHEFPIYSFVVSDLHGHVLDIPFVLLSIALLLALYKVTTISYRWIALFSFMLAVMYMTNAWDGIIYFGAAVLLFILKTSDTLSVKKIKTKKRSWFSYRIEHEKKWFITLAKYIGALAFGYIVFVLPFSIFFKPFVSGVGVICAPSFLTKIGKIGPFLFEADHCQRSPLWMLAILYGFFYIFVFIFIGWLLKKKRMEKENMETFILLLILLSTMLIIVPEFLYVKDIYPQYYRANTMFKLVYQAFMMLSLCCSYIIVKMAKTRGKFLFIPLVAVLSIPVFVFPYFAINSYYGTPPNINPPCHSALPQCTLKVAQTYISEDLKNYKGLDGIAYLKLSAPDDWNTIMWMNKHISGQPVILEAQGDSYTDYERISSYTGLPTVLGWTVHEWLWRGTYDIPAPRIAEVSNMYTSTDVNLVKSLLKKYNVQYVYVGNLERQKYPTLTETVFKKLGCVIYQSGDSRLYKLKI